LLIALMGDTFDRVTESQGAEIMRQRAALIPEIESRWWPTWGHSVGGAAGRDKHAAGRIYVLEPRMEESLDSQEWDKGRVGTLKEHTSKGLRELDAKLDAKLGAQEAKLDAKLDAQEAKIIAKLDAKLDAILSALGSGKGSAKVHSDGKEELYI
jgi:hypothetical protein